MTIEQLFFELIQVALGVRVCLSRTPNDMEWKALYDMAKKQSLVGVCFAGVQRLQSRQQEPPEMQYLTWMGMAAKIQQRNEVVNRQCVDLGERLEVSGYRYSILKGQGVASLYKCDGLNGLNSSDLSMLRQSGDIDVLLWKDGLTEKENREEVVRNAQSIDKNAKASEHHIAVNLYDDTEVEMHYAPAYFCNPFANRRFRKWCEESKVKVERIEVREGEFNTPSVKFNLVFLLAHMFRHYMSEGVGLRQVMDYYFVLREAQTKGTRGFNVPEFQCVLKSLNMLRFAGAVMWVIKTVFAGHANHDDDANIYLGIEPVEMLGRKLLVHIMQGGNFGHHNTETVASKESHVGRFVNQVVQDLKLAADYPAEALWAPISMIREFIRIRV